MAKDKKKLKEDMKKAADEAQAKQIISKRMQEVYEQAKKLEKDGIKVEFVKMPEDTVVVEPKVEKKVVVANDTVKAKVTTTLKRKEASR